MIQDICGRLENEFRSVKADKNSVVICFRDNKVLIQRDKNDALYLPSYTQCVQWAKDNEWKSWSEEPYQYVFRLMDTDYFIWMGESGDVSESDFDYETVRELRQTVSKHICFGVMTAWHLFVWYRDNRFCGRCGTQTVHDDKERMMRCPGCGNMIFPKIAPAVIIAVTDGDRILMSKYAGRANTRYALLAGFVEIGETAEQTVQREVMEEVGLRVKNVRYYKTQPWGIESDLLLGYFCDLDGDDTIYLDRNELALAEWYPREAMPVKDDGISLTREMMRIFAEGKEPKA